MIDNKHRRPVGFYERQFVVRNIGDFYTSFNVTGKFGGSRRITPEILSCALKSLIENSNYWLVYNFFRTRCDKPDKEYDGTNFEVRPLEQLNYDDAVTHLVCDTFDSSTLRMFNDLKPDMDSATLALWKVYLIEARCDNSQYVSFICDHALLDGLSGAQLQKNLLAELNLLQYDNCVMQDQLFNYEKEKHNLGDSLIAPVEELTNLFQPSPWSVAEYYISSIKLLLPSFPKWFSSLKAEPIFAHNDIKKDMRTEYRVVNFSTEELTKMLAFCRKHGITLTPFLHVVALKVLESIFFASLYPDVKFATKNCITVDGRRFMPARYKYRYGCLVSLIGIVRSSQILGVKEGSWINLMKDFHQEIINDLSSLLSFKEKGLVRYTNIWDSLEAKIGKRDGRQTLLSSNLGILQIPRSSDDEFTLDDLIFSSSTCGRYHFILDAISTEIGGLNVVFAYLPEYDEVCVANGVSAMEAVVSGFKDRCLNFD